MGGAKKEKVQRSKRSSRSRRGRGHHHYDKIHQRSSSRRGRQHKKAYEKHPHKHRRGRIKYRHEKEGGWAREMSTEPTLPLDLVAVCILSRLSVRQLCRLRCVCKAWNSVLAAGKFLPDKAKESWFLMRAQYANKQTGVRALTAFSSSEGCRSSFQLPVAGAKLSSYLGGLDWARLVDWLDYPTVHFIASAGGLICALVLAVHPGTEHDLIVFNCLTGSVKVLPRPPSQDETLSAYPGVQMRMAIDNQDPYRYYVIVIESYIRWGNGDSQVPFEVFDSRSGSWRVGSSPKIKTLSGLKVADGDLFSSRYHASDGTMDVLAYHAAEDAWSAVRVPLIFNDPRPEDYRLPRCWSTPSFLRYGGRLFMGRLMVKDIPIGFEVWELQLGSSGTATLAEVARTPEPLYQPCNWSCTFKAEGFVFCMQFERGLEGKTSPLVYDLVQNSWYVVPSGQLVDCILVHKPRASMLSYG